MESSQVAGQTVSTFLILSLRLGMAAAAAATLTSASLIPSRISHVLIVHVATNTVNITPSSYL